MSLPSGFVLRGRLGASGTARWVLPALPRGSGGVGSGILGAREVMFFKTQSYSKFVFVFRGAGGPVETRPGSA